MRNVFHRLRHFAYLVTSWWHCFGGGLGSTALGEEVQGRLWEYRPSPYFRFFSPSPPHSALLSPFPSPSPSLLYASCLWLKMRSLSSLLLCLSAMVDSYLSGTANQNKLFLV